eukprot:gene2471-2969_t
MRAMGILVALLLTVLVVFADVHAEERNRASLLQRNRHPSPLFDLLNVERVEGVEARFHRHPGIKKLDHAMDPKMAHEVIFAVKQRNTERLPKMLQEVSDPSSFRYGKHLSRKQIQDFTKNPVSSRAIKQALLHHDIAIEKTTRNSEYIVASATIDVWERFFDTKFHFFHDEVNDQVVARALSHKLPAPLAPHTAGVFGVSDYFVDNSGASRRSKREMVRKRLDDKVGAHVMKSQAATLGNNGAPWCMQFDVDGEMATACITYPQLLYNYYNASAPYGGAPATQAVFGSLGQAFSPEDLTTFQESFGLTVKPAAGAYNGQMDNNACYVDTSNCDEASLDVQYITAMAQLVPTYYDYFYVDSNNLFLDWIMTVVNMTNPADQSVVEQYLVQHVGTVLYGYGAGRGYPDVSMLGNNYYVAMNGSFEPVSGTSASAPVFAGVVSLANSARKQAGKSSLGFLNPLLYSYSSLFVHDVTVGDNKCTAATDVSVKDGSLYFSSVCCQQGFVASAGWDPVTGLGSVDVDKFIQVATSLEATGIPTAAPSLAPPATTLYNFATSDSLTIPYPETVAIDGTAQKLLTSNGSRFVWQTTVASPDSFASTYWTPTTITDSYLNVYVALMDVSGLNRFICGMPYAYYSRDGGQTWAQSLVPVEPLYSPYASASSNGSLVLIGEQGDLYLSKDYGATFAPFNPPNDFSLSMSGLTISPDGDLIILQYQTFFVISSDLGQSWYISTGLPTDAYYFWDVAVSNDTIIAANKGQDYIYKSTDRGRTFSLLYKFQYPLYRMTTSQDLQRIVLFMDNYILGYSLYVSSDGGNSFARVVVESDPATSGYTNFLGRSLEVLKSDVNATTVVMLNMDGILASAQLDWSFVFTDYPTFAPSIPPPRPPSAVPTHVPTAVPTTAKPPTAVPTRRPTAVPTTLPTLAPTAESLPSVTFTSSIVLTGVQATATTNGATTTYTLSTQSLTAIAEATAASMSQPTNVVTVTAYTAVPTVTTPANKASLRMGTTSQASTVVTATTSTSVLVLPGQSSTDVYNSLSSQLTYAVTGSTVYSTFLQTYSAQQGVTSVFATAVPTGVTNSQPTVINGGQSNGSGSGDGALSSGAVAGIVIGVLAAFALVVAVAFYSGHTMGKSAAASGAPSTAAAAKNEVEMSAPRVETANPVHSKDVDAEAAK